VRACMKSITVEEVQEAAKKMIGVQVFTNGFRVLS
jgi:hypothetical protein